MSSKKNFDITSKIKSEGIEIFRDVILYTYYEKSKQLILLNSQNEIILYNLNNSSQISKFKLNSWGPPYEKNKEKKSCGPPYEISKMKISSDGQFLALLLKSKNKIIIKNIFDKNFFCEISENINFSKFDWIFNSLKIITISEMNLLLSIYDLETQKICIIPDIKMTKKNFAISENKKFLAVLENLKNKNFVEIFDLENFESLSIFEIDLKNGNEIFWGEKDFFLIIRDFYNEGQICFYLLDGKKIEIFDNKKINFFLDEIFLSPKKKKLICYTIEEFFVIFNLTIFQKIKNFSILEEIENLKFCEFFEEIEKNDLKNPLGKKRFMISKKKNFFDSEKIKNFGKIKILKISKNENFFAFSSKKKNLKNYLFIYDLKNYKIIFILKFLEKIKNFSWTKNELIIITGNMCFYNWNKFGIHIMEYFYQNEFFARKLEIFNNSNRWFFYDDKNFLLKVYNPGREVPSFKKSEQFVVENGDEFI